MLPALIIASFLSAGCSPAPPKSVGECGRLQAASAVETCRYEQLLPTISGPRPDLTALDAGLQEIGDPTSRDLVLLRLAIAAPKLAGQLCTRVQTDGAAEKCRQVLGRPHLGTERRAPKRPPTGSPPTGNPL